MANDDPHEFEVRPAGEREALQRLNAALGLPADTPYATLSSADAMKALTAGDGAAPVAVTRPAPEPVAEAPSPLPPIEPVPRPAALPPIEPAPRPEAAAPAQAAVEEAESKGRGWFASLVRNAEGKIRKGPAFAIGAVALCAAGYGLHKLREQKQEAQSR